MTFPFKHGEFGVSNMLKFQQCWCVVNTLPRMVTSKMTQQFILLFVSVRPDPSMSYFSWFEHSGNSMISWVVQCMYVLLSKSYKVGPYQLYIVLQLLSVG